ncbi:SDR family oxidoreductase [Roseinatronobacter alkalisoli]|uniref:SDR family oxidoreductase n=1 Tax=Roseinatronobacter alkalisoli TaxID=3028235 RepID=A0ABT5TG42_9RHOB|nr:SDR family oxidoreductase [Roseinatronobacter sp. HJB301]MDD7973924.1 SDR family oxidoreductase [Roseinatronobacter sp. HJB301]
MSDQKRIALVTGGGRGIGRAIVERLAKDGFSVAFTYRENETAAADLVAELEARGHNAKAICADIADIGKTPDMFDNVGAWGGGKDHGFLNVLVCSAGVIEHAPIDSIGPDFFDRVMSINARGTFFTMQQGARHMRDGGRMVCVSTIGTAWPSFGEAIYAASKAAVEQFCRVASRELGARGITVNSVSPGPTDTDLLRNQASVADLDGVGAMTALGRIGKPEDIARVVSFLAGSDSGWVTGQNIVADGGLT